MKRLKKITRHDLEYLHKHYLQFEPYSDFNAVSLWGYMVPGARYLPHKGSVLYEVTDYNTDESYLSVFGDKSAREIITHLAKKSHEPEITLLSVPEVTCQALKDWAAVVEETEELDNHDYIFSVESIANLTTEGLRSKRKSMNKLLRKRPNLHAKLIDHSDAKARTQMYNLFKRWIGQSHSDDWQREYKALQRALKIPNFKIVCIGAYDKNRLVGFTVNEIEANSFYQGHYGKADYRYPGLGFFLEYETAKYIHEKYGSKFMNLQQDMGIEGLRYYKQSLGPSGQLKKYTLRIDTKLARKG